MTAGDAFDIPWDKSSARPRGAGHGRIVPAHRARHSGGESGDKRNPSAFDPTSALCLSPIAF